jgi:hypothetical protein
MPGQTTVSWLELDATGRGIGSSLGGIIVRLEAGGTLLLGDGVTISADAGIVGKTASAGSQLTKIGLVVGGERTSMEVNETASDYGVVEAAHAGEIVLVCLLGIAYGIADGAVAAPVAVGLGTTTAGRLIGVTNQASTVGVGIALEDAAAAGNIIKVLVMPL